jgi:hypothetical protein
MREERCECGGFIRAESLDACDGPVALHVQSMTHQIWRGIREGRFPASGQWPTVRLDSGDLSRCFSNASAPARIRRIA